MSNIIIRTKTIKAKQHHYLLNDETDVDFEKLFSRQYLKQQGLVFAEAQGRAVATMFNWQGKQLVLKKYCRGGLVAKFNKKNYLFTGLKKTRVYKEFSLLQLMHQKGLPVSTPCYAEVIKNGAFYQAKIITQYIANSKSLADVLENQELLEKGWKKVGRLIRQFHDNQVYHADLNARNILLVGDKGYLIDFDRSTIKSGETWKAQNLNRLKRSLLKIQNKSDVFYFDEQCWQVLVSSYAENII